eukprot:7314830-Lingulodinium_polyedra.AAC.1
MDIYTFQRSINFAITTYNLADAATMAAGWIHKMEYFHRVWRVTKGAFVFTEELIKNYQEPEEFTLFASKVRKGSPADQRVTQIRSMRPSHPVDIGRPKAKGKAQAVGPMPSGPAS